MPRWRPVTSQTQTPSRNRTRAASSLARGARRAPAQRPGEQRARGARRAGREAGAEAERDRVRGMREHEAQASGADHGRAEVIT